MLHRVGQALRDLAAEAGAFGEALRDEGAATAVVAAGPLADVVQERREEHLARVADERRRLGRAGVELVRLHRPPRLDDRAADVHVDRVDVEERDVRLVAQRAPLRQHALQPLAGGQRVERAARLEPLDRLDQPVEVATGRRGLRGLLVGRGAPPPRRRELPPPAAPGRGIGPQRLRGGGVDHAHRLRDAAAPLAALRAEILGNAVDEVAPQLVVRPLVDGVEGVAGGQQQLARLGEFGRQPGVLAAVGERARELDPVDGLERAEAAPAGLHVGLLHLPRLGPHARLAATRKLLAEPGAASTHEVAQVVLEAAEEVLVAGDEPRVEQRGAGLDVVARRRDHLLEPARGVPHLQPAVPQRVQHVVHDVLVRVAGEEQHQVHVGVPAQLATPVAAEGDDGGAGPRHGLGEAAQAVVERVAQAVGEREPGLARGTREGAPGHRRARLQEWL